MNSIQKIFFLYSTLLCIDHRIDALAQVPVPSVGPKKNEVDSYQFKNYLNGMKEAELNLEAFLSLRQKNKVVVLDVRSRLGFNQEHIKNSINIPLTELTEHTLEKHFPDRTVHVVLVCEVTFVGHGSRRIPMTIQAWPVLKASGYENVHTLVTSNYELSREPNLLVK